MDHPSDVPAAPSGSRDTLLALFRNRNYGFYVGVRVATLLGQSIQAAAIMWQVYDITRSPMALAFVGILRFAPSLAISLVAGAITDNSDRRKVLAFSQIAPLSTSLLLGVLTAMGTINMAAIYSAVFVLGIAAAFEAPSRSSILPLLVPPENFQRGVTVATIVQQVASILGPAGVGLTIDRLGVGPAYLFHVFLTMIGLVCLMLIRADMRVTGGGGLNVAMIKEGIVFIRAHPAIFGAMALDMVAVIFAGADALLPIYARDVLNVGASGFGLLTSAKGVGSLVTAVILSVCPPIIGTGRALVISITLFGITTVAFGLCMWFPLSLLLYGLLFVFDQVSVVMRQSIIQLGTPNELRGRVGSVNQIFVGASNQLGAAESGMVAAWTGSAVIAVVSGGVACLIAVALLLAFTPTLWRHRQDTQAASPAA